MAFLQFTSGSTSRPKGVVLTHANLLANAHNIVDIGLDARPDRDAGVTKLPLFHDMGLIGFVLSPLLEGIPVSFMSPLMFLKRPSTRLKGISRYKGTNSFGPNFAYALSIKRIRPHEIEGIDLSSWRVAGCGAEPIRAETLEAFATAFAHKGFRKDIFLPAYGMAESTLAISFDKGLHTDFVRASTLWTEGRAEPSESSADDTLRIVSCGKAFEGHDVGVFALDDDLSDRPLPDRRPAHSCVPMRTQMGKGTPPASPPSSAACLINTCSGSPSIHSMTMYGTPSWSPRSRIWTTWG